MWGGLRAMVKVTKSFKAVAEHKQEQLEYGATGARAVRMSMSRVARKQVARDPH